jgi:hypothetical protein
MNTEEMKREMLMFGEKAYIDGAMSFKNNMIEMVQKVIDTVPSLDQMSAKTVLEALIVSMESIKVDTEEV